MYHKNGQNSTTIRSKNIMILTEMSKLEYFREEAFSSAWELAQIPRGDDRLDVYFQHVELPGKKDTGLHWHRSAQPQKPMSILIPMPVSINSECLPSA